MNMEFLYVLPRWEGSTADSHVFENVWRQDFGNQMGTITWLMSRTRSFIRFSELESLSLDTIRWLVT
jgi:hypothetical protein